MRFRTPMLVVVALVAFAANSLLNRAALVGTAIDPVTFTALRLVSGAAMLWLLVRWRDGRASRPGSARGSWPSALALFAYALLFSLAYVSLTAATGALLLFGAVQVSMVAWSRYCGDRLAPRQWAGFGVALAGLVVLLLPGLAAPAPLPAAMMVGAGVAWAVYTLRARGAGDPIGVTAGNFLRASVPGMLVLALFSGMARLDAEGALLAVASGAIASGLGYVVWYAALRHIATGSAAVSQLAVPVLAAVGGMLLLGEVPTLRLVVCGAAVLGGIALVVWPGRGTRR